MQTEYIYSPLKGNAIKLENSPDPVFAGGMLGLGIAIDPNNGKVFAPVDGTVTMIFNTKHAIGIKTTQGNDILIHFGLDTVHLQGEGFKVKVEVDQKVKKGDLLLVADLKKIRRKAPSVITPITITNSSDVQVEIIKDHGIVSNKDVVIAIHQE